MSSCSKLKLLHNWSDRFSWRNNRRFGCFSVNGEYGLGHGCGDRGERLLLIRMVRYRIKGRQQGKVDRRCLRETNTDWRKMCGYVRTKGLIICSDGDCHRNSAKSLMHISYRARR